MSTLLIDRDGPVVTLTLNRPDKLNALNAELVRELVASVTTLGADRTVRAAILTAAGGQGVRSRASVLNVDARGAICEVHIVVASAKLTSVKAL